MEEILASIRKIISEDSTEAAPEAPAEADADILELTQEVHDEAPAPAVIAAAPPAPEPVHVEPEPALQPDNDVVFQSIEETAVSSEAQAVSPAHEGIFSDKTRKALEDSFANIPASKPEAAPTPAHYEAPASMPDGASVQAVFEKAIRDGFGPVLHQWLGDNSDAVVEKLKPLVREWMDEHFPALLEGAVRAEVERVARARH
jgi:cell pole-organizing protein PopZ